MFNKFEFRGDPTKYPHLDHVCHYKQISVSEHLVIPSEKPEIEQLYDVKAHAVIEESTIIKTPVGKKLVVKGFIEQKIIYVAKIPCQPVHAAHFTIPFCDFQEISSSCTLSACDLTKPNVIIEFLDAKAIGPKEIAKCVILFIWWPKKIHQTHPCHCVPHCPPHPCQKSSSRCHRPSFHSICEKCKFQSTCKIRK